MHLLTSMVIIGLSILPLSGASKSLVSAPKKDTPLRIVFFGDSLTAGYSVDPDHSYPSRIRKMISQRAWKAEVVNAGISGDTSSGGLRRVSWILKKDVDIFVLALGANDALRGLPPRETKKNLAAILKKVQEVSPQAKLVVTGIYALPNLGEEYGKEVKAVFSELAKEFDAAYMPFLLEGVAAERHLNLPDGLHPNKEGYKIISENIWKIIEPILSRLIQDRSG